MKAGRIMQWFLLVTGILLVVVPALTHERRRGFFNILLYGAGLGMVAGALAALFG